MPSPPSATAKPAEPRSRDADRSQQAILLAARDEFAQHGLGGARVDRIAERADLNKRLIYYYFKSKDDLFLAVLEQAYADIRAAETKLQLRNMAPTLAIRRLTEFTWEYYIDHPEFLTLLNSENLHLGRHLAMSSRVQEMNSPLVQTLAEILERGRADGLFRGGIDPVQLYVSIAGMSYFYLSNNHTLSAIFGRDLMTPKARHERLSHMCDVVLGYVLRN
ncbi:MAG: TetR family transcriptional regulator [Pseudomonadota bacterium]|uniref:TetR family transcriptional regulator n=1 Tax=Polaromonas sp. TaxID=1869339 RepID=UPI001817FBD8|nr:TetR family transcriptional regulator [Polaromonas sp.]MBA3593598.1 TetR family transcriptional regulator [Polaromonas sp.]MDQ3272344.1 TetR family transcriptional regulator [Pseudomonadota bacterium]